MARGGRLLSLEGSTATSRLWDVTWRPGVIRRHDNRGRGNWAAVCRVGWAWPAEPRRAGGWGEDGARGAPWCPRGRAPLCPLWGATCRPPRRQGRGGTAMRGGEGGSRNCSGGERDGQRLEGSIMEGKEGPGPNLDMELRSAPGASVSSPVKWGQRHLPGRDRTRALSATQARKGSETAQLLPFRSGQPVDASSGKPS